VRSLARPASAVDGGVVDPLVAALDLALLVSVGWDPATETLTPDRDHPLLGWPVCRVAGCELEAWDAIGLCTGCQDRLKASGEADIEVFCRGGAARKNRPPDRCCLVCRLPGFERPVATNDLCSSCDGLRRRRGQTTAGYVNGDGVYPRARPRPSLGGCTVAPCQRLAARPATRLCGAHDAAWRMAGRPDLDGFRRSAPPCLGDRSGRVALAGLDKSVTAEVLYGVQTALREGRRVMPATLRHVADHLRRTAAASVAEAVETAPARTPLRWLLAYSADRASLVRSDIEGERAKEIWDLRLWGAAGRLSFVGGGTSGRYGGSEPTRPVRQAWLKQSAKAWAAGALCSMTYGPVRAVIGAVGLFSESLARRHDAGDDPSALDHRDIEVFLARLGHLQRAGRISAGGRDRTVTSLAKFLRDCREMGLTQPGGLLGRLGDDVTIRRHERPKTARRDDEVGLALPEVVMAQLLAADSLDLLESQAGPTIRAAIELEAGVGRRTGELCSLRFGCLDFDVHTDRDGQRRAAPVLVHDMPKVAKVGCRLPVHDREAAIISAQQDRVRANFPDTPNEHLVLFPRPLKNPDGTKPIGTAHIQRAMRAWVTALPRLDGPERDCGGRPVPFPRDRVFPYTFRHSYAQRHADAGTPVDTLKELLGHDTVRTTLGYYRVTAKRKRAAADALGPLQVDAVGRLVRPGTADLSSAEILRDQIGQVAVPFGVCTEPTNVSAEGRSCPFRHRCLGCTYFRTDPSYQPELSAYLAQLLADRERLATAGADLAPWAQADAAPCDEEIDTLRRLTAANRELIAGLGPEDRQAVETAITTVRTARAALDTTFPVQFRHLARQAGPTLFPTIERDAHKKSSHG
jgi:integrase